MSVLKLMMKLRKNRVLVLMTKEKLFKLFLDLMDNPKTQLRMISILFHLRNMKFDLFNQRVIYGKFNEFLNSKKLENITHNINPLLLVCLISVFLLRASRNETFFSLKLLKLATKFRGLSEVLMNSFDDLLTLKFILMKRNPLSDRPLIEILFKEKEFFNQLLMNDTISKLVSDKWRSAYKYDSNFFIYSTSYNYARGRFELGNSSNKKSGKSTTNFGSQESEGTSRGSMASKGTFGAENVEKLPEGSRFVTVFSLVKTTKTKETTKNNHINQFLPFRKSLPIRLFINFLFYLILFGYIYYIFEIFLTLIDEVTDLPESYLNMMFNLIHQIMSSQSLPGGAPQTSPANITNTSSDSNPLANTTNMTNPPAVQPEFNSFKAFCSESIAVGFLKLNGTESDNFINVCLQFTELGVRYENSQNTMKIALILCILLAVYRMVLFLYALILYRAYRLDYILVLDFAMLLNAIYTLYLFLSMDGDYDSKGDLIDELTALRFYLTILAFLLWIKFLDYLRLTKTFGVLVTIMLTMIKDLLNFFVVLLIVLLAFTSLFNILYRNDSQQYSSLYFSFQTILSAALGAFTFDTSDNLSYSYGSTAILTVYLFLTNIILLNLLIAILTNSYEKTIERSTLEHSLVIYSEYKLQRPHKCFSSLVQFPPPFNVLSMAAFPLLVFCKSEKVNNFVLEHGFRFYNLVLGLILIIVNTLVFVPVAWIRILLLVWLHHTAVVFSSFSAIFKNSCKLLLDVFLWIFFGMPYLGAVVMIKDMCLFWRESNNFVDNKNKFPDTYEYEDLKTLRRTVAFFINIKKKKRVPLPLFRKQFSEVLKCYYEGKRQNAQFLTGLVNPQKPEEGKCSVFNHLRKAPQEFEAFNDAKMWSKLNSIDKEFDLFAANLISPNSGDKSSSKEMQLDLVKLQNLLEGVRRMKKLFLARSKDSKVNHIDWFYIIDIPSVMKSISLYFKVEARKELDQEALDLDFED